MESHPTDTEPELARFGGYRIIRRVAVGGMAELFEATQEESPASAERVIIKVLLPQLAADDETRRAFAHEAQIASAIEHPNLIPILDHGVSDGRPFLVMEKIDGSSLAAALDALAKAEKTLPASVAFYIVREVLTALKAVHQTRGDDGSPLLVVHRDVSPQNILLSRRGDVRVGDFGIALSSLRDRRTRTGVIKGKTQYLAPEQVTLSTVDHRTDLYATGLVLWEALAGEPYLQGASDLQLLKAAENPAFRPPSALVGELDSRHDHLVRRALARFPEQRFQTAGAFLEALGKLSEGESVSQQRDALSKIVEDVVATQSLPRGDILPLPRPKSSPTVEADPRGTKVSNAAAPSRSPLLLWSVVSLSVVASIVLLVTLWRSNGGGEQPTEAGTEVASHDEENTSVDPSHGRDGAQIVGEEQRDQRGSFDAGADGQGPQRSGPVRQGPTAPRGERADEPSELPSQRLSLNGRLESLRRDLAARGVHVADLEPAHRRLFHSAQAAIRDDRLDDAAVQLDAAERVVGAVQLDRAFVQRKLDRVDGRIRRAQGRGIDTAPLEAMERVALREFVAGRLEATNVQLNRILRSLDQLERAPATAE